MARVLAAALLVSAEAEIRGPGCKEAKGCLSLYDGFQPGFHIGFRNQGVFIHIVYCFFNELWIALVVYMGFTGTAD